MKKNTLARIQRAGLVAAALLALAGTLVFSFERTRSIDAAGTFEIAAALRELKQRDAQWGAEALRPRTGAETNTTPAAPLQRLIISLQRRMTDGADGAWADHAARDRLGPMLADLAATVDAKAALIERVGSPNPSQPDAVAQLRSLGARWIDAANGNGADPRAVAELQEAIEALVADATAYLARPDAAQRARIGEREATLRALALRLPSGLAAPVDDMHARLTAVLNPGGAELPARLAAIPTAIKIERLLDAFNEEHARLLAEQEKWMLALVGYAVALLAVLGLLAWRLLRKERLIEQRSLALKRALRQLHASKAALVHAGKMSSVGRMATGVADEIDAPLSRVKGTINLLRDHVAGIRALAQHSLAFAEMLAARDKDPAALAREYAAMRQHATDALEKRMVNELVALLDQGAAGIDEISLIATRLQAFSRLDRARVSGFDVRRSLEGTLRLAQRAGKRPVEVIKELREVAPISCAPALVELVFANLLTHAVQSIPEGRQGFLTLRTEMDDDKTVRIEIQDNGAGIPNNLVPKLFDPLSGSRHAGGGAGVELAIAYEIVKQHGGAILVDTELDVGTVFTILLPVEPLAAHTLAREAHGAAA